MTHEDRGGQDRQAMPHHDRCQQLFRRSREAVLRTETSEPSAATRSSGKKQGRGDMGRRLIGRTVSEGCEILAGVPPLPGAAVFRKALEQP